MSPRPLFQGDLDPEDERILNEMMPQSFMQTRNLADMIMERIREKEHAKEKEEHETVSMAGSDVGVPPLPAVFHPMHAANRSLATQPEV